ncbi:hypothetical protein P7C70_g2381, partial [Phenoliferia sp. Uapishka_3]
MPYAMPSPSTSPSHTFLDVSANPDAGQRPLRHHMRSQSSDALVSTSFIYVRPVDDKGIEPWASKKAAGASSSLSSTKAKPPAAGPRRAKLFGFTPAHNDDGPSSQEPEEDETGEAETSSGVTTPKAASVAFPFGQSSVPPLIPVHIGRSKSASVPAPSTRARDIEDAFASRKTHMVRKKSGELVRSSLKTDFGRDRSQKPRSEPSTPTCPKYVHFDTKLEHVKHFLSQQRPAAVSRSGSPVETETEDEPEAFPFPAMVSGQAGSVQIKLPNFPSPVDATQDAYLETLEIQSDCKSLRGVVRVKNLSFQKWVAVRFTLDNWQTVSEVSADHLESMGPMSDRFVFSIRLQDMLAHIEEKTMFIAIRYTVGGQEIWDNNKGGNYRVEFVKRAAPAGPSSRAVPKRQAWSVVNAGQAADRMADLRRELDRLGQDDMDPSPLHAQTRSFTEGSPSAFATRYDFGNSFKMSGGRGGGSSGTGHAGHPTSPTKPINSYSPSNFIGGMPATLYPEPPSSESMRSSPILTRDNLAPDFGTSSKGPRQTSFPLHAYANSHPQRPPSPPAEPDLVAMYGPYLSYLPLQDISTSRGRFNPAPPAGSAGSGMQLHTRGGSSSPYAPLVVPGFRDHRRKDSPFASPADSPKISPLPSPSTSPPRSNSPPLYRVASHDEPWSPTSSIETASTASSVSTASSTSTYSPDSATTSVPDSPVASSFSPRPNGPKEFSNFLDRYCFHQSSVPSHLSSVSGSGYGSSTPIPSDNGSRRGSIPTTCGPPYHAPAPAVPSTNATS